MLKMDPNGICFMAKGICCCSNFDQTCYCESVITPEPESYCCKVKQGNVRPRPPGPLPHMVPQFALNSRRLRVNSELSASGITQLTVTDPACLTPPEQYCRNCSTKFMSCGVESENKCCCIRQ